MKLLNHTTKYFAFLLIILMSVWAVVFYFAMLDEVYDSLDDGLENQKVLIIQAAEKDPDLLEDTAFGVNNYTIKRTSFEKRDISKDSYRDTVMFMQNENEFEPVRILESVFEQDGLYYKIKLITSMVEEDDQIENLFKYLVGLYLVLVTSILLLNNLILKKVWRPFYDLVDKLRGFRIERDGAIKAGPTTIDEFELLNQSVEKLTQKSRESYLAQKEFIENAAHELQTPLAIGINRMELLLEQNELSEGQSKEVGAVLESLDRMTRLNRSLLLLSKIDNQQYVEEETIDFNALAQQLSADFEDFSEHRNIELKVVSEGALKFNMNKDLAVILLTNLIKNAMVHGTEGKSVDIDIFSNCIHFTNFGGEKELNAREIFKRFSKSTPSQKSTGLGLAIAKAIANMYSIQLTYHFSDRHTFELQFPSD